MLSCLCLTPWNQYKVSWGSSYQTSPSLLSLRGAITRTPFLAVEIHFTPLLKTLRWTPRLKGSYVLVLSVLIRLFHTPHVPGNLDIQVCCSQHAIPLYQLNPWLPKPFLHPWMFSFHHPSFQVPSHIVSPPQNCLSSLSLKWSGLCLYVSNVWNRR